MRVTFPLRLFELLQNVLALGSFADFLQAAEAVDGALEHLPARRGCSGMWRASTRTCGFMITMRSIRFFSSRTLPGQWYSCSTRYASASAPSACGRRPS